MQKLKLKSIYKFCISCRSSHTEQSKIGFAIFGFFYDFICIFKFQTKHSKLEESFHKEVPRTIESSQKYPLFASQTLETSLPTQMSPWCGRRRSSPESGKAGGGASRGGGVKRPGAHHGSGGGRNRGWKGAGEGARRRPAVSTAGARAPATGGAAGATSRRAGFKVA
jgi:hypothetical protein